MENQNNFYSVSDLALRLDVPRTTINDWLKKFDRYIDFEMRGRRKVYTDASLEVLKMISSARDKGLNIAELEKELAAKCAVRPEISPLSEEPSGENETLTNSSEENLPALNMPDMLQTIQQVFERCGQDFETRVRAQEHRRKRGFLLVSVLLVLLLAAACATLLLLGQLLTLKESSKTLEMRLAASRDEAKQLRENTQKEFKLMAQKVEFAGRSGVKASAALQEKITAQRRQFEKILVRLEQAEKIREKEIARQGKEIAGLEKDNARLKSDLAVAAKLLASEQKKTAAEKADKSKLEQKCIVLEKQVGSLKLQISELEKQLETLRKANVPAAEENKK